METMAKINTSCLRIKLALRPTKINGRRKRKRSLVLAVTALEGNNMRGPCLVMVVVRKSHLEVALKSLRTCGTCIVARVVDGTAPILQLSCCFHFKSIFLSLCLACHTSISSKDCKRTTSSRTYSISSYCFSAAHSSTVPSSNHMVSLNKNKLLAVCECHEHAVADPTVTAFLSDLKKLLN